MKPLKPKSERPGKTTQAADASASAWNPLKKPPTIPRRPMIMQEEGWRELLTLAAKNGAVCVIASGTASVSLLAEKNRHGELAAALAPIMRNLGTNAVVTGQMNEVKITGLRHGPELSASQLNVILERIRAAQRAP